MVLFFVLRPLTTLSPSPARRHELRNYPRAFAEKLVSLHEEMLRGRYDHAHAVPIPLPTGPDTVAAWDSAKDHLFERAALEEPLKYLAGCSSLKLPYGWEGFPTVQGAAIVLRGSGMVRLSLFYVFAELCRTQGKICRNSTLKNREIPTLPETIPK